MVSRVPDAYAAVCAPPLHTPPHARPSPTPDHTRGVRVGGTRPYRTGSGTGDCPAAASRALFYSILTTIRIHNRSTTVLPYIVVPTSATRESWSGKMLNDEEEEGGATSGDDALPSVEDPFQGAGDADNVPPRRFFHPASWFAASQSPCIRSRRADAPTRLAHAREATASFILGRAGRTATAIRSGVGYPVRKLQAAKKTYDETVDDIARFHHYSAA